MLFNEQLEKGYFDYHYRFLVMLTVFRVPVSKKNGIVVHMYSHVLPVLTYIYIHIYIAILTLKVKVNSVQRTETDVNNNKKFLDTENMSISNDIAARA